MSKFAEFLDKAKADYDHVNDQIAAFEKKIKHDGEAADAWTKEQAAKLKADLAEAKDKVTSLANRISREGEEAADEAHDQARRHWDALHAAVSAYRDHLDKTLGA